MPMVTKPCRVMTYYEGLTSIKSHGPLPRGLARSRDKLNSLYIYYQSGYDDQTWQDVNSPRWTATHKVTRPFDHVILRGHVTS